VRPESNWRKPMENLTEKIRKDLEAKNPERKLTDAEKKANAAFVSECRMCNPFTKRYFNLTRQIELKAISPDDAAELKECAKYEGVDEKRANPGLAESEGGKDDA